MQLAWTDWARQKRNLSERDRRIALMYARGMKIEDMARELGMSGQAVSNVLNRHVYPYFGVEGDRSQRRAQMARAMGVEHG